MIDEERTFELYGYTSDELKPKSNKRVIAVCEKCGVYRDVRMAKCGELCRSCARKKLWDDAEFKKKASAAMKKAAEDPEFRKRMSFIGKMLWEDDEYKQKMSLALEKGWEDASVREKRKDSLKKAGECTALREKRAIAARKRWENDEFRKNVSATIKKTCNDPEYIKAHSGENHPNWRGGASFGKYCSKFNNEIKQYIREKYGNCDYISGIPASICSPNRKLDVHHVDYNKQQGCDENEWRLIPLSHSNHARTNANMDFWNRLFTYSLQYDETYYSGEDIDIWEMITRR